MEKRWVLGCVSLPLPLEAAKLRDHATYNPIFFVPR